jgi:tellurite resistance protein TehA-like permease
MMATDAVGAQRKRVNPKQLAASLRLIIATLAVFCFNLGIAAIVFMRDIARHDPYQVKNVELFGVIAMATGVICLGVSIHVSIRRLVRATEHA